MLQQTRVAAVLPYYQKFLRHFPTVQALARARMDEVLRYWVGLGYYRRARHLKEAAKEIVREHHGRFPADYEKVLALLGIGRYTAAAVLSIAYGRPYAVLDGNVARVVARLACLNGDVRQTSYRKKLQTLADELLPHSAPGDFNQAMMELGSTVCLPRRPLCERCPVESLCEARRAGLETTLPGKERKPARVAVNLAAAIVERDGKVLLVRESGGFFSGLWQFPSVRCENAAPRRTALRGVLDRFGLRARIGRHIGQAQHTVTHHDVRTDVFLARLNGGSTSSNSQIRWVPLARLGRIPVSSATKKIARLYDQHFR